MVNREAELVLPHLLQLEDRKKLRLSGVSDVDSFDEETVAVITSQGKLIIKGEGLHIGQLNVETGDLTLEGIIRELLYTEAHTSKEGFFKKLFR